MDNIIVLVSVATAGIALAVVVALLQLRRERHSARPTAPTPRTNTKLNAVPPPPRTTEATRIISPLAPPPTADDEMDWLAQAADELHTPLMSLRDQVRFLRQNVGDASRTALITVAERLVQQVEQLDSLIEAWSATARQTGPQRIPAARPVELATLTRMLIKRLAPMFASPGEVVAPAPLWVLMDPQTIERILTIAVMNAYKSAPSRPIEVVMHQVPHGARQEISIAIADRRSSNFALAQDVWESLELDLARVLLEEYGGHLERDPRGGGGIITTIWLPATLLIRLPRQDSMPTFTRLTRAS